MKKILLLDDSLDIIQIVEEVLSYEHFKVKSLTDTQKFFEIVESFAPELIILDYKLSDESGGEICRKIKADPDLKDIPVIIFSAYTQPGLDFKAFGCDAFIAKPFDLQELVDTISELLTEKYVNN